MNMYVISAYLISLILIAGKLVFTIVRYNKSKKILENLKNEKKT
ncbi:CcmD-like small membrane protein [Wolbachia endosymbiont of Ctenocephalides felis]